MIDTTRVTDALPSVSCVASPADFKDIVFTPSLLLPARFSAEVVASSLYQRMCGAGFDWYFDQMCSWNTAGEMVFVARVYTWTEIVKTVVELAVEEGDEPATSVVGYLHGWLSALALTDRQSALMALEVVCQLFPGQCC